MAITARENLFHGALRHVDLHVGDGLEARSSVPWSSQALCISVFGTIAESANRAALMQSILAAAGVDVNVAGDPEVLCEVRGRRDLLNEIGGSNATCPDVLVEWPGLTLTIESKFTEHLSPCGQIDLRLSKGSREIHPKTCSGNHETGSDLKTKTDAACRLTIAENEGRRGYRSPRRYWEVGSRLFGAEVIEPPREPCPFADGKYQLMRNLCFASALAESQSPTKGHAFVLAYVEGAPSAADSVADFAAFREMLLAAEAARVGSITYETISDVLASAGEAELAGWVRRRLQDGLAAKASRATAVRPTG